MSHEFDETSVWFAKVGQQPQTPAYDAKQVCFYLGMQLEELGEKLGLIAALAMPGDESDSFLTSINELASAFKSQTPEIVSAVDEAIRANPEKWIDADCDNIWVTIGAIRAAGIEPACAYFEVVAANWAKKFDDGTFHKDANGKIVKPEGWKEPDFALLTEHLRA